MHLAGKLHRTTLGDVIARLGRERVTGTLRIKTEHETHRVYFKAGDISGIVLGTRNSTSKLGDLLLRNGRISQSQLAPLLKKAEATQEKIGEVLIAHALIDDAIRDVLLRRQLKERIEHLFELLCEKPAEIFFDVGVNHHVPKPAYVPLRVREVIRGKPRARDRLETPRSEPFCTVRPNPAAHSLLRVPLGATQEVIRRAFRKQSLLMHPDRFATQSAEEQSLANERFRALVSAYHELMHS